MPSHSQPLSSHDVTLINDRITVVLDRLTALNEEWAGSKLGRAFVTTGMTIMVGFLLTLIGSGYIYLQNYRTAQYLQEMENILDDIKQANHALVDHVAWLKEEASRRKRETESGLIASSPVDTASKTVRAASTGDQAANSSTNDSDSHNGSGATGDEDEEAARLLESLSAAAQRKKSEAEERRLALDLARTLLSPDEVATLEKVVAAHEAYDGGRYEESAALFEELAKVDPETASHLNNAGAAYYRLALRNPPGGADRDRYLDLAIDLQTRAYKMEGSPSQWQNVFGATFKRNGAEAAMQFYKTNKIDLALLKIGALTLVGRVADAAGDKQFAAKIADMVLSQGQEGLDAYEDDPDFRYVRNDPYYDDILRKYNRKK